MAAACSSQPIASTSPSPQTPSPSELSTPTPTPVSSPTSTPSQAPTPSPITGKAGELCYDSPGYFVITKTVTGHLGESILIKQKQSTTQSFQCTYTKAAGDIELTGFNCLAVIGDKLVLDAGTAPPPRSLFVYDLVQQKYVFSDQYSGPTEIGTSTFSYWQPVETKPTTQNCPDLATWQQEGVAADAEIQRHVTLDAPSLKVTDLGQTRCSLTQGVPVITPPAMPT